MHCPWAAFEEAGSTFQVTTEPTTARLLWTALASSSPLEEANRNYGRGGYIQLNKLNTLLEVTALKTTDKNLGVVF